MKYAAFILCLATSGHAETVVATRSLPPNSILTAADVRYADTHITGTAADMSAIIGMETRVALYAGRPIYMSDIGFPAVVNRNQIVPLIYDQGIVKIATEGRALDRAGPGETIRVMNINSRSTVTARIGMDGAAYVGY